MSLVDVVVRFPEIALAILGSGSLSCRDLGRVELVAKGFTCNVKPSAVQVQGARAALAAAESDGTTEKGRWLRVVDEAAQLLLAQRTDQSQVSHRQGERWLRTLGLLEVLLKPLHFTLAPPTLAIASSTGSMVECAGYMGRVNRGVKDATIMCLSNSVSNNLADGRQAAHYGTAVCGDAVMRAGRHQAESSFQGGMNGLYTTNVGIVPEGLDPRNICANEDSGSHKSDLPGNGVTAAHNEACVLPGRQLRRLLEPGLGLLSSDHTNYRAASYILL